MFMHSKGQAVYVLLCVGDDLYTGCSADLPERLGRYE